MKRLSVLVVLAFLCANSFGQVKSNAMIRRAMNDELKRSMDSLLLEGYEKPFFIAYTITDTKTLSIGATLGSLTHSNEFVNRGKYTRVMVGDYDFNDESYDPRGTGNSTFPSNDIAVPIDDDYLGIRRSLWSSTDAIYKSAGKIYKDNMFYAEQKKKEGNEVQHRSFAKVTPVQMEIEGIEEDYDKVELEEFVKKVSLLFNNLSEIEMSRVVLSCHYGSAYIVNSEGVHIKTPINLASLYVLASYTNDSKSMYDQILHFERTTKNLPSYDQIKGEIDIMLENFENRAVAEDFDDSYDGPVLFVGDAVPYLFERTLFHTNSLIANHSVELDAGNRYNDMDRGAKIGKRIISNKISVVSIPTLRKFSNTELLGSYQVDFEGVIPDDELLLIENGVLKATMNDRTIVDSTQTANGHRRLSQDIGPGVLSVISQNGEEISSLKAKLIKEAKDEGLEYAVIVRQMENSNFGEVDVYRVSLESGEETLMKSALLRSLSTKSLNKVIGLSSERNAYNLPTQGSSELCSYIVPTAILIEDIEIEKSYSNYKSENTIVSNPVGSKQSTE